MKRRHLLSFLPACLPSSVTAQELRDAPDFRVRTLAQASFTRASLRGKVVLIQFWATWCGFCRRDQEALDEIYMDLAGKGLEVLAVNAGEPEKKVRDYLRASTRVVPVALSSETDLLQRLPAPGFPTYYVINRPGKLAATTRGAQGRDGLLRLLEKAGLAQ